MKIKEKIAVIILCPMLVLAGCQVTPEKEVVVNKNDGVLEEKVYSTDENTDSIESQFQTPSSFDITMSEFNSMFTLKASADIVAKSAPMTASGFSETPFSKDEMNTLVDALFGENEIYKEQEGASKQELEEELIRLKKEYEDKKRGVVDSSSEGGATLEDYERIISEIEMQIAEAPSEPSGKIASVDDYIEGQPFSIEGDIFGVGKATLHVEDSYLRFRIGSGYYEMEKKEVADLDMEKTKDEAIDEAQMFLQSHINSFVPVAVMRGVGGNDEESMSESNDEAYIVICERQFGEISSLYTGSDIGYPDEQYSEPFYYEQIKIAVNDRGIVDLTWNAHGKITDVYNDDVELKSYKDIVDRFEQQIKAKYAYFNNGEDNAALTIQINEMKLGYLQVKQKDRAESIFVPVWGFYGWTYFNNLDGTFYDGYEKNMTEDELNSDNSTAYTPILMLNAIDGSNIPC